MYVCLCMFRIVSIACKSIEESEDHAIKTWFHYVKNIWLCMWFMLGIAHPTVYINLVWMRECEGCTMVVLSLIYSLSYFLSWLWCTSTCNNKKIICVVYLIFRTNGKSINENMKIYIDYRNRPTSSIFLFQFVQFLVTPRVHGIHGCVFLIGTACAAIFIIQ